MQFNTRGKWFIAAGALVFVVLLFGTFADNSSSFETLVEVATPTTNASTSSIPLRVGGVVKATNDAIVYAQVAGVLATVSAVEGISVTEGQLLARQSLPVVEARLGLTAAQGELSELQQQVVVVEAAGAREKGVVQAYSATDVARLRVATDQNRRGEVFQQLQTSLESSLITSIEAIDFVNQNRSLFTGDALRDFDEVVKDVYGRTPNYFSRSVNYGSSRESSDLEEKIIALKDSEGESVILAQTYSTALRITMDQLLEIYATAEEDVYDHNPDVDTTTINEFETNRAAIFASLAALDEVQPAVQQTLDGALANSIADSQAVAVTAIDEAVAQTVAEYAARINTQVSVVDAASQAVILAEFSLGEARAPFTGVVTDVYVDPGDYATPGTPLVRLSGTAARELAVMVPAIFADSLAVGQEFVVAGDVVGTVTSYSPVSHSGSIPVTILLTDPSIAVGSTLTGYIHLAATEDIMAVPRQYVFFTTTGPYVRLVSGREESFTIVYDDGEFLYGTTDTPVNASLVQATGIHF